MPIDLDTLNGPQREAVLCTEGPLWFWRVPVPVKPAYLPIALPIWWKI